MSEEKKFELKSHSYAIADTGDYDGYYEITNGKVSIMTKDDDDEALQPIVDALNDSGCSFYLDDSNTFLMHEFEKRSKTLSNILTRLINALPEDKFNAGWMSEELIKTIEDVKFNL